MTKKNPATPQSQFRNVINPVPGLHPILTFEEKANSMLIDEATFKAALHTPHVMIDLINASPAKLLEFLENQMNRGEEGQALVKQAFKTNLFICMLAGRPLKQLPVKKAGIREVQPRPAIPVPEEAALRIFEMLKQFPVKTQEEILLAPNPDKTPNALPNTQAAYGLYYNGNVRAELLQMVESFSEKAIHKFYSHKFMGRYSLGRPRPPEEQPVPPAP
jgi:hypothetical protein